MLELRQRLLSSAASIGKLTDDGAAESVRRPNTFPARRAFARLPLGQARELGLPVRKHARGPSRVVGGHRGHI
jgi:hypothetical protein